MQYYVFLLFVFFGFLPLGAKETSKDSLLRVLSNTEDIRKQVDIYRNLADLSYRQPKEIFYLKQLAEVADKSGNKRMEVDALGDLADCYIEAIKLDSAKYYKDRIANFKGDKQVKGWLGYLELKLFDQELTKEDQPDVINEKLKKSTNIYSNSDDVYAKIEEAYIIASGLYAQRKIKDALPFYDSASDLAEKLPLQEGFNLRFYILKNRERAYSVDSLSVEGIQKVKEYSKLLDAYYQKYIRKNRPFFPIESMQLFNYVAILGNYDYLTADERDSYMQKVERIGKKLTNPKDLYYGFLAQINYYTSKKDYDKVLGCTDSLLKYAEIVLPHKIPSLYNVKSQIYETVKDYPEALRYLKMYYAEQDSLTTVKSMEQLSQLQVRYDLHQLNYEKSQLEVRNKRIMLIFLYVILFVSVVVSLILYRNLKKEKAMKLVMNQLKDKAEESEKMKTAFISSVCHEIRTPLNAIVGFSDLLFENSIDEETRKMFPGEIQRNTTQLTGLINSMLEVSSLDVSDEKLPCEPVDLVSLCHREMEILMRNAKSGIQYRIDIPDESLIISTNERYLALVLENLLGNANKFSDNGEVILCYQVDRDKGKLYISVTDTGCGIPLEKQEEVFERFTKLDSFKPGNGLGLYLCRLIIRRLSGDIKIDQTYSNGVRVLITLPLS